MNLEGAQPVPRSMFASVGVHGPVLGPTAALALDVVLLGAATLLLLSDKRLTRHQGVLLLSFVALVAVLRVVMANLPNVQPVTVAVLLAGASLGARRGVAFAILVTMLSNAVLGDGYWTLFQAAGWAMVAVVGSRAHLLQGDRLLLGRATLLAGALALPFGLVTNLSLLGGGVGLAQVPALVWMGLPFDLSHALGNVVFMLWTGPFMPRMMTPVDVPDVLEAPGAEADVHLS